MNGRILLVEDEPAVQGVLADALCLAGYEVVTRFTALGLAAALAEVRPALLLLDVWLPGEDGLTALRAAQTAGWQGPTVLMSASPEAVPAAEQPAGLRWLRKPFSLETLWAAVAQALGGGA